MQRVCSTSLGRPAPNAPMLPHRETECCTVQSRRLSAGERSWRQARGEALAAGPRHGIASWAAPRQRYRCVSGDEPYTRAAAETCGRRAEERAAACCGPPRAAYDGSVAVDTATDGGAERPQPAASPPPESSEGTASTMTCSGAAASTSAKADPRTVAASAAVGRDAGFCAHARMTRATTAGGASGRSAARLGRSPFWTDTTSTPTLGRRLEASAHALARPDSRHHRTSA